MAGNLILDLRTCKTFCTFLVLLLGAQQASSCPTRCQCGDVNNGQKYVQCDNVNLTALPSDIPIDTALLFFSTTKITRLTENYFSRLSNLQTIEFSNNHIENITDGVFNGLPKLERLNLASNGIKRISSNAFAGLTSLKKLSLSGNQLTTLPRNLLKDLTSLQTLNLDTNYLHAIPEGFLNNTGNLQRLKLNGNKLTRIDDDLLQRLTKLNMLDLSKNQIIDITEHAFLAPGTTLYFVLLDNNKLSSFPKALYDLKYPFILELRLLNNSMTTIPQEAKSVFDRVQFGKIRLSGNPYRCAPGLQWLQSWTSKHHVVQDINDVTCTTLSGGKAKLAEYDFNRSVSSSIHPTSTPVTSTATTTTTSTPENIPTTHASLTSSASELQIVTTTTLVSSSTEVIPMTAETQPKATDTITIISDKVSSTQQIPAVLTVLYGSATASVPITLTPTLVSSSSSSSSSSVSLSSPSAVISPSLSMSSSSALSIISSSLRPSPSIDVSTTELLPYSTNTTPTISISTKPTENKGKVDTSILDKKEHIILATCLSAAFIAVVVFVAMYCFRKKIIKRDKIKSSSYDRVRVV